LCSGNDLQNFFFDLFFRGGYHWEIEHREIIVIIIISLKKRKKKKEYNQANSSADQNTPRGMEYLRINYWRQIRYVLLHLTPRKGDVEGKMKTKKTIKKAKQHQLPLMSSVINERENWRTPEWSRAFVITTTEKLNYLGVTKNNFYDKYSLLDENTGKKIEVEDT